MKSKDQRECLAILKSLHSNNNLKLEQKVQIEVVIDLVKTLGRKKNPSRAEIFACVKEVTKRLLAVLSNDD